MLCLVGVELGYSGRIISTPGLLLLFCFGMGFMMDGIYVKKFIVEGEYYKTGYFRFRHSA